MPLPVIDDTFRIAVNFSTYGGVTPVNVFHISTATANVTDIAASINNCVQTGMYGPMNEGFEPGSFQITPLDGHTATQEFSFTTIPANLCLGDGAMSPAMCAIVSLHTLQRGPRGRGRVYVGPIGENAASDGFLEGSVRTNLLEAWENFEIALLAETPAITLVVASYTHEEKTNLYSLSVRSAVGTQRRRQDQLV